SLRQSFEKLNIELVELEDWYCCGATPAHMTSRLLAAALPIDTLILAEKTGLDMVAPCAACFNRLRVSIHEIESDPTLGKELEEVIGDKFRGEVEVKHPLEVLAKDFGLERLSSAVVRRLEGLRVACYYGCLMVRPPKVMKFDDDEDPTMMDVLIDAIGAEPVLWYHKVACCGATLGLTKADSLVRLSSEILRASIYAGADCIAVACPLCQSNLDLHQDEMSEIMCREMVVPILYFSQLLGLSLGCSPESIGLDRHIVSPRPLLERFFPTEG
ncbi:MAG: CoB--CoM heterodisulfide reductase iron-sulfur subunit B family protein, partial [bacterium]